MNPLVSIIIPTYNRAHLIGETLDSVLAQTYTYWECIVVDDGSVDDTINVINKFIKDDNRFKLIKRPTNHKKGASVCRNIGIKQSKGVYIQFLDSDDLFLPNKIFEQINLVNQSEENIIVTCKWGRFNNIIGDSIIYDSLKAYGYFDDMLRFLDALAFSQGGYFPIHAYLIKKDIILKVGLWNEYLTINDDTEFMMRVIANTNKIYFSANTAVFYRYPLDNNLSSHNSIERVDDALKAWELIDSYLKIRFENDSVLYMELMKNLIYLNVKNSFPELIKKHDFFFNSQIKAHPRLLFIYSRFKNKIKKIVKSFSQNNS